MEDLKSLIALIVGAVALVGGFIFRDRQTQNAIRSVERRGGEKLSEAQKDMHKRVDKVKDEYVRRDDLGTHMEHVTTGLADVKAELQRTNTRLDELLKPSKS